MMSPNGVVALSMQPLSLEVGQDMSDCFVLRTYVRRVCLASAGWASL
jgi:hypothetical protein